MILKLIITLTLILVSVVSFTPTWTIRIVNPACTAKLNSTEIEGYFEQPPPQVLLPRTPAHITCKANSTSIVYDFETCRHNLPVTIMYLSTPTGTQVSCRPECTVTYRGGTHFSAVINSL
ncbi:hypothetical protein P9112_005671 [Eukaryota sp. TZLM1-RC]